MPLPSPKRSSRSEPILCRSGQSKSSDRQPEAYSVNHGSRGLFVALTAYRFNGKPKLLSHGSYPTVSLQEARDKREAVKVLLAKDVIFSPTSSSGSERHLPPQGRGIDRSH
ncbi:Arm DNA-binding domain-containing protein [Shinella sp. S4-D37]|uniref:Arm DNA-binding domain-containing protein n=1 Tax=Shinella sp. S4-D37 TaxID=3161999 RepID=UPI003466A8BA